MADINPIPNLEPRVAVLEEIAADTKRTLERIERQFETRLTSLENRQHTDFLWLLAVIIGSWVTMLGGFAGMLGVMAHGFHWI